ncbi:MAG: hypothetical protein ACI92Z_003524 [Paracoccaceae bacterium]|jgi:hypothetical protein
MITLSAPVRIGLVKPNSVMDAADRNEPALPPAKVAHLQERIIKLKEQMQELKAIEAKVQAAPDA